jgi:anti-sigma factor RsiW
VSRGLTGTDLEALSAYLDGELDETGRVAIERLLDERAEAAERLVEYRQRDAALRTAFRELPAMRRPDLSRFLPRRPARGIARPARRPSWSNLAAAVLLIGLVVGGWLTYKDWRQDREELAGLMQSAASAHLLYPGSFEGKGPLDPEGSARQMTGALGLAMRPPDLSALGFRLTAVRALTTGRHVAVLLAYRDAAGQRISCYFERSDSGEETGLQQGELAGLHVLYRLTDRFAYAVVGEIPPAELQKIAEAAYVESGEGQLVD